MLGQLLLPEIEELVEKRQFGVLRELLVELTPVDMADLFADLPPERVAVLFRILPRDAAAEAFAYFQVEQQESLLTALGQEQVAAVLNDLAPDDRTALLEEVPGEVAQKLINLLSPEERKVAQTLLGYPSESIGRLMTPDYVAIRKDWTAGQVIEHLRRFGRHMETLNMLYVTDAQGRLIDDIPLREVVLAEPNTPIADLMDEQFVALHANEDQEVAVPAFKKYDRSALPVIDSSGTLVGIITVDDVLDVVEEEETEDVQKMGAVAALEAPYLEVNALQLTLKRAGWLVLLFLGSTFTISAMAHFEGELEKIAILSIFIPLVLSSGGNSGSQASTLVTRALAVGEIAVHDWWRVVRREVLTGLMLGGMLALLAFGRINVFPPTAGERSTILMISTTVALSLIGVVIFGTMVGSMLPLLLKRLGLDPAVSSTPFVATLCDVTGLGIYFWTAKFTLHGTLL